MAAVLFKSRLRFFWIMRRFLSSLGYCTVMLGKDYSPPLCSLEHAVASCGFHHGLFDSAANTGRPPIGFCIVFLLGSKYAACQEFLTKKSPFSQETLIKTLLQQKQPNIKTGKKDLVLMKRKASALLLSLALLFSMG